MDPVLTVNYTKIKHECVYFIIFTSSHFDRELFKIGVTTNLTERLKSLRQEFKINGNYKLLLAIPVGSDEIEKDLLNAFQKRYPTLKINLSINNCNKTECFLYDDILIESVEAVKTEFSKQANKRYIENIDILVMGKQEAIDVDVAYISWTLNEFYDSIKSKLSPDKTVQTVNMISDDQLNIFTNVITQNGVNYYNVSNWGKQVNKSRRDYNHWKQTKNAQEQINACKEESGLDEVIIDKTMLKKNEYRGMYVYDHLAVLIAIWIDTKFGIRVAKLVNERIIKEKDDKINILTKEIGELKSIIEKQKVDI